MFYNTPNGLQIELDNGWTVSISLDGNAVKELCEIAVWPTGLGDQENWVRWGANSIEPPETDWPIYTRAYSYLTSSELLRIINGLSKMSKEEVEPNKWLSKGLSIWK